MHVVMFKWIIILKKKEKKSIALYILLDYFWHIKFFAHAIDVVVHYNDEIQLSKYKHVLEKFFLYKNHIKCTFNVY